MHYVIGAAFGLLSGAGAILYFDRKLVRAARLAADEAMAVVASARYEYTKLKAGLAHKLDQIL